MAAKKQVSPIIAAIAIVVVLLIVGGIYYALMGRKASTSRTPRDQEGIAKMKQMMQQKMQQGEIGRR